MYCTERLSLPLVLVFIYDVGESEEPLPEGF